MTTLDTRLKEITQRLDEAKRMQSFFVHAATRAEVALLLKLVEVYREALVTIECGLVTSESTAKFAGLRPKQIAHSALTTAEAIARGEE